jgi:hypothetical protein
MIKANEIAAVSRSVIGAAFNMHPSNVNRWEKRGCPRNPDGKTFNLADVISWRLDELALTESTIGNEEATKWLTAFRRERALLAEIERKKAEENLLPKKDVLDIWISRIHMVKNGLLSWSGRLSGMLEYQDRKEIAKVLDCEVNDLLESFAREDKYTPPENREAQENET